MHIQTLPRSAVGSRKALALIVVIALLGAGAFGYRLGQANSAGHAVAGTGQSVSQAAGQAEGEPAFRFGPADRAGVAGAAEPARGESAFPYGPADRAGVGAVTAQAHGEPAFPFGPADRAGG